MAKEVAEAGISISRGGTMASSGGCQKKIMRRQPKELFDPPPLWDALLTYISYALISLFGYLADFWRRVGVKRDIAFIEAGKVSVAIQIDSWVGWLTSGGKRGLIKRDIAFIKLER